MTEASRPEWEMAIVLPLGAVANQLQRIEAQLRLLNMKALDFARERENHALRGLIEGRLEQIGETLESVTTLVSDIGADLLPSRAKVTRLSVDEETESASTHPRRVDARPARDEGRSSHPAQKPYPGRDD